MATTLSNTMIFLTITIAGLMIPRMLLDWQRFRECLLEQDNSGVRRLIADQNAWMIRHGVCATAAIMMVVGIKLIPEIHHFASLADVTAVYAVLTLAMALVESFLAQYFASAFAAARIPGRHTR